MSEEYIEQFVDGPSSREIANRFYPKIMAQYLELERMLREAERQTGTDGSFGLKMARERLFESKIWAKRDLMGPESI